MKSKSNIPDSVSKIIDDPDDANFVRQLSSPGRVMAMTEKVGHVSRLVQDRELLDNYFSREKLRRELASLAALALMWLDLEQEYD